MRNAMRYVKNQLSELEPGTGANRDQAADLICEWSALTGRARPERITSPLVWRARPMT